MTRCGWCIQGGDECKKCPGDKFKAGTAGGKGWVCDCSHTGLRTTKDTVKRQ